MKYSLVFAAVFILLLLVPETVAASGTQQITYSGYSPAIFRVTFPQTTKINVTVVPESGGLYTYSVSTASPDSAVQINLNSSDIYDIYLSLSYPLAISGDVVWSLSTTGLLSSGGSSSFVNQTTFLTSFSVKLLPAQVFPSAQEIANATSGLLVSRINQLIQQMQQAQNAQNAQFEFFFEVAFGILGVVVVVMVALFFVLLKKRRLDE